MDKEKILTNEGVKKVEVAKPKQIEDQDLTIDKVETEYIELPNKVVPSKEPRNPMKEDITKPREEPRVEKPTYKEKKEYIKESNEHPEAKRYGVKAMKKSTYIMMWVTIGIILSLLIWSNTVFSIKDFSPQNNFTINNNPTIETTVPTTNNNHNNFTIVNENQLTISDDKLNNLSESIADKILLELNLTNSTL